MTVKTTREGKIISFVTVPDHAAVAPSWMESREKLDNQLLLGMKKSVKGSRFISIEFFDVGGMFALRLRYSQLYP